MKTTFTSRVEQIWHPRAPWQEMTTPIPYITVDNFPKLGLLTALRFLEWAGEHPEGVISLPTGKTPEYFIKYTQYLLENWDSPKGLELRAQNGLENRRKPRLDGLHFVQVDEFYPIDPRQHNSFYNYVLNYYIRGFQLKKENCLLINSEEIQLHDNKHFTEVFPGSAIDLSLRYRDATSTAEEVQQKSIMLIDNWCSRYEEQVRRKGGIGFFLGGIGPDGHIAFNTRGSDHFSTTRLTATNFETQAVAAGDLGGMEVARNRLVITIGLETITHNPDAVSIIFAAGEAKAGIIKDSLESEPSVHYPATVLQRQQNSRFYLTAGAASRLTDSQNHYYNSGPWTDEKTDRSVIDLCQRIDTYAHHLDLADLQDDPYCSRIPGLDSNTPHAVIERVKMKIASGMAKDRNETIYHTGPHHDDIMLGLMPYSNRQVRSDTNEIHFSIMTSGFTAVTNKFVIDLLGSTRQLIEEGRVQMLQYPDFFDEGYLMKWDKDVYHYLNNVAGRNEEGKLRGLCHRIVRSLVKIGGVRNVQSLLSTIDETISILENSYDGSKNPPNIQVLKGMIREFEEELVWAHFGVPVKNIHHLRLGFYKGDIFTELPEKGRDIEPILNEFRKYQPTILSLAMDPEGSGPDTHYKVLQAIAGAVKVWQKEKDLSDLRIIGYRNVWFRFHPAEADLFVPVSLNALDVLQNSFNDCYNSQLNASFPSYAYDGKFSELTQKIWVQQLKQVQYVLGKNFFYENQHPLLRATHGMIYLKELNAAQFVRIAEALEEAVEKSPLNNNPAG